MYQKLKYIQGTKFFLYTTYNHFHFQNFSILPLNKVYVTAKNAISNAYLSMFRLVFLSFLAVSIALRKYGSENLIPSSCILSNLCLWPCAKCALSGNLLTLGFITFYQNTTNSVNKFHECSLYVIISILTSFTWYQANIQQS